jgi:DUF4097 and DUF4098 domain-containing protein YvlB
VEKAITILAIAAISGLSGCAENSYSESFDLDGPIDRVVVDVDTGDVDLRPGSGQGGRVDVEMTCRTAVPQIDVFLSGSTLHVSMDAGNGASACDGSFEIVVPGLADVDLRTGSGDIAVEGTSGEAELLTYDGDIRVDGLSGSLELSAVSGAINATALESGECGLTVGAGDVEASFATVPELVDIEVGAGDATVNVPASVYRIEADSDAGEVLVSGLVEQQAADNEIWIAVTSGDINIIGE